MTTTSDKTAMTRIGSYWISITCSPMSGEWCVRTWLGNEPILVNNYGRGECGRRLAVQDFDRVTHDYNAAQERQRTREAGEGKRATDDEVTG